MTATSALGHPRARASRTREERKFFSFPHGLAEACFDDRAGRAVGPEQTNTWGCIPWFRWLPWAEQTNALSASHFPFSLSVRTSVTILISFLGRRNPTSTPSVCRISPLLRRLWKPPLGIVANKLLIRFPISPRSLP